MIRFVPRLIWALVLCLLGTPAFAQSTFNAQIHNAPGWLPTHPYPASSGPPTAPFTRVVNGPAWNGSVFTNGATLNAYVLVSGNCTSGSGSGPTGTSNGQTDGSCTWNYVGPVDYVTITGWTLDNGSVWTSGTTYGYGHVVHTTDAGYPTYQMLGAGCVSTVKPTTTSIGNPEQPPPESGQGTSDGCFWDYRGQITYTSNTHPVPHGEFDYDSFTGSISGTTLTVSTAPATHPLAVGQILRAPGMTAGTSIVSGSGTIWTVNNSQTLGSQTIFASSVLVMTIGINDYYVANLWNDREYLGGANGELQQIMLWGHNFRYNDSFNTLIYSPNGATSGTYGLPITIKAALGEDFGSTLAANPSVALAGYNVNNGVGIRGTGPGIDGIWVLDNTLTVSGLQIKADSNGSDPNPYAFNPFPGRACNSCLLDHDLLEGAVGAYGVLRFGAQGYISNSLIISHGIGAVAFDYGGYIQNSTVVCPGGGCGAALFDTWDWISNLGVVMNGNAFFGFTHLLSALTNLTAGSCGYQCSTWQGINNATDVASTDGSTYPAVSINPGPVFSQSYIQQFIAGGTYCAAYVTIGGAFTPGTCQITNSLSPSAAFTTWPGNYRIGTSSTLYGIGAGYGNYNKCGIYDPSFTQPPTTNPACITQADTPDILGAARPQGGRYDVGAVEYAVVGPFTFTGNSLSNSTFVQGNPASTIVGAVIVGYTGTATGTTTISLSGTNAHAFRLDTSVYPGANLICPAANCPFASTVTDINVVATNSAATGSPRTDAVSLTGTPASPLTSLRIGIGLTGLGRH